MSTLELWRAAALAAGKSEGGWTAASTAPARWLVVADADVGAAASNSRAALPAARREATAVARMAEAYGETSWLLVADAATESAVKQRAVDAGHLHFAVHSEVDAVRPLESALQLRAGDGDDGALRVWEVYEQLSLDVGLVVLSSCSSALGRELRGQGLLGLARAFRHARARRVVASLWPVEDTGTDMLMRDFYAHLAEGRPDAALRAAVLDQLGTSALTDASPERGVVGLTTDVAPRVRLDHPYYWAGFQVYRRAGVTDSVTHAARGRATASSGPGTSGDRTRSKRSRPLTAALACPTGPCC